MSKEEALNQLDTQLNQNGLAAIRNGRTLTIVNRDEAKTQNIPVLQGNDPEKIPITDKIVTQIIPVRFVEVDQLIKDLQPLVSSQTTMTANQAGNSLVITDTQANIRKVVESTYQGSSFNYVQGFQHKGTPLINSEYGGIGALDPDRQGDGPRPADRAAAALAEAVPGVAARRTLKINALKSAIASLPSLTSAPLRSSSAPLAI